jgi:hypothetical protein
MLTKNGLIKEIKKLIKNVEKEDLLFLRRKNWN